MRILNQSIDQGVGIYLAALAFLLQAAPAAAQNSPSGQEPEPLPIARSTGSGQQGRIWGGLDGSGGSLVGFVGGNLALNGDINADGLLVRAALALGEYETEFASFAVSDVNFSSGSLLLGYQRDLGGVSVSGYFGPEFVHNGKGASADVLGTEWGARAIAEVFVPTRSLDLSTWATYSTFENQYFIQGQALYHQDHDGGIGPEVAFFGGDGWSLGRAGLRVSIPASFGQVGVGTGYQWGDDNEDARPLYANLVVVVGF